MLKLTLPAHIWDYVCDEATKLGYSPAATAVQLLQRQYIATKAKDDEDLPTV